MPDTKAYAVGDATDLTGLTEGDDLMTLLPAGEYNLTLASTATATVPALTAGTINQAAPTVGDTLTVSGSNAPATGIAYNWQIGGVDLDPAVTTATLDTTGRAAGDYRRGVAITGLQAMVYTPAVAVAAADITAPIPSAVSGTQTGATTATWSATSNEAGGTMFAAAWPAASADPTAAQVIAGTGGSIVAASSDTTPTADANNGGSLTGLTASTEYQVGVVHRDAAGNDSTLVVSAGTFTTAAPPVAGVTVTLLDAVGSEAGVSTTRSLTVDLSGYAAGDQIILATNGDGGPTDITVNGNTAFPALYANDFGTNRDTRIAVYELSSGDISAGIVISATNYFNGGINTLVALVAETGALNNSTRFSSGFGIGAAATITPTAADNVYCIIHMGEVSRFNAGALVPTSPGLILEEQGTTYAVFFAQDLPVFDSYEPAVTQPGSGSAVTHAFMVE